MNFEEMFKSWTLEQKVEWALGPNICNLSENMRSIIVDLKAENERLKAELQLSATKCNKLRYERLMAKALFLKELKHNGDYFYSSVGSKTWEEIEMQLSRISRAYEDRAKRIKDGK